MKKDYFLGLSEEGFHKVAFTEWGKPNKTLSPIICVHGLTRTGRDFDDLGQYLGEHGQHVFCPDIVGRGDSDWLKNPLHYTYEQYMADMTTMIAFTQAKQVDWIGTSMGGLIGMGLAALPNSPIRRLVLNDVGAQVSASGMARIAQYVGNDPDFNTMDEAIAYFKIALEGVGILKDDQWQRIVENTVKKNGEGKFIAKADPAIKLVPAKSKMAWKMLLHPLKAAQGTVFDIDLWHIWQNVTCPVLIIHGKNSDILTEKTIKKMQSTHPNTEVISVSDAAHAPALMDVEQHEVIYKWLMK